MLQPTPLPSQVQLCALAKWCVSMPSTVESKVFPLTFYDAINKQHTAHCRLLLFSFTKNTRVYIYIRVYIYMYTFLLYPQRYYVFAGILTQFRLFSFSTFLFSVFVVSFSNSLFQCVCSNFQFQFEF